MEQRWIWVTMFLEKAREAMARSDIYENPFRSLPGQEHLDPGERMAMYDDELGDLQKTLTLLKTAMLVQEYGKETPAGKANLESYSHLAGKHFPSYDVAEQILMELRPEELQKLRAWTKVAPPVKK